MEQSAVEFLLEQLFGDNKIFGASDELIKKAKELEEQREKTIFSIAYRMTPIMPDAYDKQHCEEQFQKFKQTFKSK